MFIGCLALAIAEMLDSIPIFAEESLSATAGRGHSGDGSGKDLRVTVLFCHRTASDRAISREILPEEQAHK